jgi:phytoene synthase
MEDLARFNYTPKDIAAHACDDRFVALMNFQANRALEFYKTAAAELPPEDKRSMTPARIMAEVYGRILGKMRAEGFRVYEKRYSLGKLGKVAIVSRLSLFSMFLPRQR